MDTVFPGDPGEGLAEILTVHYEARNVHAQRLRALEAPLDETPLVLADPEELESGIIWSEQVDVALGEFVHPLIE